MPTPDNVADTFVDLPLRTGTAMCPVINATVTLLHTNPATSPSGAARQAVLEAAGPTVHLDGGVWADRGRARRSGRAVVISRAEMLEATLCGPDTPNAEGATTTAACLWHPCSSFSGTANGTGNEQTTSEEDA